MVATFQPMNINFGLFPEIPAPAGLTNYLGRWEADAAAALALEVSPGPGHPRQHVFQLRDLDLRLPRRDVEAPQDPRAVERHHVRLVDLRGEELPAVHLHRHREVRVELAGSRRVLAQRVDDRRRVLRRVPPVAVAVRRAVSEVEPLIVLSAVGIGARSEAGATDILAVLGASRA